MVIKHQQLYQSSANPSLRKTDFINLIIDETTDISTKQMLCICLRYVENDCGTVREEIFKLGPISDTTGESKII